MHLQFTDVEMTFLDPKVKTDTWSTSTGPIQPMWEALCKLHKQI